MADDSLLARSGHTEQGGKLTARKEVLFTESEVEELAGIAVLKGVPVSELIRHAVRVYLHGEVGVMRATLNERGR